MFIYLRNLHRFLANQLLYPIILSSLLAMGFYVGRVILSHSWETYQNLVWNLFLAWVPYAFSLLAAILERLYPRRWWLLLIPGAIWLIFFPNAPYLLTDFLHLEPRPRIPLWYDIGLLASFAWTGLFLGIASLRIMQRLVNTYLGEFLGWLFAAIALGLGGLGLYLGRFSRWNSWDLFLYPRSILVDVTARLVDPASHLRFFGFVLMFSAFLLVCYLTFISVHRTNEVD